MKSADASRSGPAWYASAMDDAGIPALIDAIRHLHGCEATHVETVPVHEMHGGRVVWDGEVEVFELTGHPKAKRAYAWSHATEGAKRKFYAVLSMGRVNSPVAAVRASIVASGQN